MSLVAALLTSWLADFESLVFAKCRDSVAQGRRLENLSWRLWAYAATQPQDVQYPLSASVEDLPQLLGSAGSIQRQDSCDSNRSRGRERHITSDKLEKMVVSIMDTKLPLNAPLPAIPHSPSVEELTTRALEPERTGSTTTESPYQTSAKASSESVPSGHAAEPETQPRTIVTGGFSPSQIPVSRIPSPASNHLCVIPNPTDAPAPKITSSESEEELFKRRDLEARKLPVQSPAQSRSKMFQLGGQKKTASFDNRVTTQAYTSSAIRDTNDDYDESATDDDDEDWEDESAEESGSSVAKANIDFTRVDSSSNLPTRRSLITLMLSANDTRAQRLGNTVAFETAFRSSRSASSSPHRPSYLGADSHIG